MNTNLMIQPTELDVNENNINQAVELRIIQYNKSKIRKELEILKNKRKIELNDESYKLTKEEKEIISIEIINSLDTKQLKDKLYSTIKKEKENYIQLRSDLYGLNQINKTNIFEYITVEKSQLYSFDKLPKFNDLLINSLKFIDLFNSIKNDKKTLINNDFSNNNNNINDDIEKLKFDALNYILKIKDMYLINNDIDDIELFEKYEYNTNIDYSHELSEILKQTVILGDNHTNYLNEFIKVDNKKSINNSIDKLLNKKIINNKLLSILFSKDYISSNEVTCFENMFDVTLTNKDIFMTRTLGELLIEITNPENLALDKEKRQQIYMTYDGTRPGVDEYYKWNGLQIYDLDLKNWIKEDGGNIDELKQSIHNMLVEFNWYLWICKSASGKGLHIYTKIAPPFHIFTEIKNNEYVSKYIHRVNYLTKRQVINDILFRLHKIKSNNIKFGILDYGYPINENGELTGMNFHNKYLDNIVSRITAGIRLSFDLEPLINNNFLDLPIGFDLLRTIDGLDENNIKKIFNINNTDSNDKTYNTLLNDINDNLAFENYTEWLNGRAAEKDAIIDLSKFEGMVNLSTDLDEIKVLNKSSINYVTRYNICNTLASFFGKEGLPLAHIILDSEGSKNVGEINSFYSCAISNRKEPTKLGIELLKKHGIIKSIKEELVQEITKTYKHELTEKINQVLINDEIKYSYNLSDNQYLSDLQENLEKDISGEYVNFIMSPAGSGKTNYILNLARQGKKIMLVLPYISIIQNKVESDKELRKYFDIYYGNADIKNMNDGRNIVTTFDKLSRANYEKISRMFDYIFIDEEHLIYISSYRIDTTSNVIKKIKDLYYISNNDPFAAKIVMLTGTPIGHEQFFSNVANVINVSKKSHKKTMEFLICDDNLDALTRMSLNISELLKDGYTLMIPTNKGELYTEKLMGMIEYLLNRTVKYGYYKRSNMEQEICQLINEHTTVGDYEIIFCSNYLSVGVDINDKDKKFASIYLGNFSAYEIEQFNARIRKESIRSLFCVITQKADGGIKDELLYEPDLILRITDDEAMQFIDDKALASAKNEFLATYDPILRKITTPGFSILNGKIDFNLEEYELVTFENKYSICMEHPIKVARELSKYGYEITVSEKFEGLDKTEQEVIKKIGIESMHNEKQRKHNLLIGTFIDLVKKNNFHNEHGLEFFNLIEWISKNSDKIIEDRNLFDEDDPDKEIFIKPIYDIFATPVEVIVKSKEALEKMLKHAKFLIKRYSDIKAINIIMQYVDDKGILKLKYFQRAINLLKLIDSSEANELAEPISKALNKMYQFVDKFETDKNYRIGYETFQSTLDMWCNQYIDDLGIKVTTKYAYEKIKDGISEMLNDLCTRQTSKNGMRFNYNKLPQQDSTLILNRRSIDSLVTNMFKITETVIESKNKIKNKHILLEKQEF